MKHRIKLPSLSDTGAEVMIAEWLAAPGDSLEAGSPLLIAETDKLEVEVPTPVAGVLLERLVADGDEVMVGTPIAIVESA